MFLILFSLFLSQPTTFENCQVTIAEETFDLTNLESISNTHYFVSLCNKLDLTQFEFVPQTLNANISDESGIVAVYCANETEKKTCVKLLSSNAMNFILKHESLDRKTLGIIATSEIITTSEDLPSFRFNFEAEFIRNNKEITSFFGRQFDNINTLTYRDSRLANIQPGDTILDDQFYTEYNRRDSTNIDSILHTDLNNLNYYKNTGYQYSVDNDKFIVFQPVAILNCPSGYTCDIDQASSWMCTKSTQTCTAIATVGANTLVKYPIVKNDIKYLQIIQQSQQNKFEYLIQCKETRKMKIFQEVNWINFISENDKVIGIEGESNFTCPIVDPIPNVQSNSIFCDSDDDYILNTFKMDATPPHNKELTFNGKQYQIVGNPGELTLCPSQKCYKNKEDCRFWLCPNDDLCYCMNNNENPPVFSGFLDSNPEKGFRAVYSTNDDTAITINYKHNPNIDFQYDSIESLEGCDGSSDICKATINALSKFTENDIFALIKPPEIQMTVPTRFNFTGHIIKRNQTHQICFKVNDAFNTSLKNINITYKKCHKVPITFLISLNRVLPPPIENATKSPLIDKANIWGCWKLENNSDYCHPLGTKYIGVQSYAFTETEENEMILQYNGLFNVLTNIHFRCSKDNEGEYDDYAEYEEKIIDGELHQIFHLYSNLNMSCPKKIERYSGNPGAVPPTPTPINLPPNLTLMFPVAENLYLMADLNKIEPINNVLFTVFDGMKITYEIMYGSLQTHVACPEDYSCTKYKFANFWHCEPIAKICEPLADFRYGYNISFANDLSQIINIFSSNTAKLEDEKLYDYDISTVFAGGADKTKLSLEFICDPTLKNSIYDTYAYKITDPPTYVFTVRSKHACQTEYRDMTPTRSPMSYQYNQKIVDNNGVISPTLLAVIIVGAVIVLALAVFLVVHYIKKKQPKSMVCVSSESEDS